MCSRLDKLVDIAWWLWLQSVGHQSVMVVFDVHLWWWYLIVTCDGGIWRSAVMVVFDSHLWRWYLTFSCDGDIWHSPVMVIFDIHLWWWYLTFTCDGGIWCSPVMVISDVHLWWWYLTFTCDGGIQRSPVLVVFDIHLCMWYLMFTCSIWCSPVMVVSDIYLWWWYFRWWWYLTFTCDGGIWHDGGNRHLPARVVFDVLLCPNIFQTLTPPKVPCRPSWMLCDHQPSRRMFHSSSLRNTTRDSALDWRMIRTLQTFSETPGTSSQPPRCQRRRMSCPVNLIRSKHHRSKLTLG